MVEGTLIIDVKYEWVGTLQVILQTANDACSNTPPAVIASEQRRDFLLNLAALCDAYNITAIRYTNDDDGTHIYMQGTEIFVGDLVSQPAEELRKAAHKTCATTS